MTRVWPMYDVSIQRQFLTFLNVLICNMHPFHCAGDQWSIKCMNGYCRWHGQRVLGHNVYYDLEKGADRRLLYQIQKVKREERHIPSRSTVTRYNRKHRWHFTQCKRPMSPPSYGHETGHEVDFLSPDNQLQSFWKNIQVTISIIRKSFSQLGLQFHFSS